MAENVYAHAEHHLKPCKIVIYNAIALPDWLKTFLALPNGIPSHDTFSRVFARVSPWHFQDCFTAWVQSLTPQLADQGEIVPLDGKTLRRSYDTGSGKAAIHMVHAWAIKNRLVLGQFHCEEALEEITIIPELLRVLDLKGCIVTTDALGCHTSTAEQVVEQQADYVLAVKDNPPKLHAHLQHLFDRSDAHLHADPAVDYWATQDQNHGRHETRRYWTTNQIETFAGHGHWPGVRLFGMVEATRHNGDTVSVQRRYYISTLDNNAQRFGQAGRGHWAIENSLHWILDVVFNEDQARIRSGHGPENMAVLRHIALNLLKQDKTTKAGIQTKRLKAGWDNKYLANLLANRQL